MMSYTHSISQADQAVQALLSGFIEKTYGFISSTFKMPLLICLLIYLIFIGYGVISGWFQLQWKEFSLVIVKLVGVGALMFHWSFFQVVLVKLLVDGSAALVHALTTHLLSQSLLDMSGTTESVSQNFMSEVASVGLRVWKIGSFYSPAPVFLALILWLCGMGVVLYGMIHILISKIMMSLLLASAPIILIFALFKASNRVVSAWLQLLLANFLTLLLVSIAMNLSFYLLHQLFDSMYQNSMAQVHILELIPVILLSVLSFFMIKHCVSAALYMGSKLVFDQGSSGFSFGMASTALKSALRFAR